ncbi:hypothetical protein VNI00_011704 [Paramarasmius palmivorus]|uniref:Cyclase n=1 Tax=Paramarasmius palmivorus TaxID=297713 RepID=A0AAW0CA49_9AGAR
MSQKLFNLSHTLSPTNISIYPGDPVYTCTQTSTIPKDGYSVHTLSLGTHTGTHVDAPSHWFKDGKTIDQIDLNVLVGKARIIDLREFVGKGERKVTWDVIEPFLTGTGGVKIVVIRTGWSQYWGTPRYLEKYPFVSRHAAEELVRRGVEVLGVDTLSPDEIEGPEGYGVHEVILGAGRIIAENLNLNELDDREEVMVSFAPLSLAGCDGAPVRAIGWDQSSLDV